jgi:hydrogenase maturation protease
VTDTWEHLVIVGMGNPLLTDDGVGHHAARALGRIFPGAVVHTIPVAGMDLLDIIEGYQGLCLVDAAISGTDPVGRVTRLLLSAPGRHGWSSHGPELQSILTLGHHLGIHVPQTIVLYGIEIGVDVAYGEELTPRLKKRFNTAIKTIAAHMKRWLAPVHHHG